MYLLGNDVGSIGAGICVVPVQGWEVVTVYTSSGAIGSTVVPKVRYSVLDRIKVGYEAWATEIIVVEGPAIFSIPILSIY